MPVEDSLRWNTRYRHDSRYANPPEPRPFLIKHAARLPANGLALDAAMGLGGNAAFLLAHGLRVIGIDISDVALRAARARLPGLMAVQADLQDFYLLPETVDVILNFYFLQRSLWPAYVRALRPGGLLIFETLTCEMLSLLPGTNRDFLLEPGELAHAFPELQTLDFYEGWTVGRAGRPRATASLLARK